MVMLYTRSWNKISDEKISHNDIIMVEKKVKKDKFFQIELRENMETKALHCFRDYTDAENYFYKLESSVKIGK